MLSHPYLFYCCLGALAVQSILLLWFSSLLRKVPFNYCAVTIWTLLMSYIIATCCACSNSYLILLVAGTTLFITLLLSFYACVSDIHYCNVGAIIIGFIGSFLSFWIFYHFIAALDSFYFAFGLFIYSLYLVFDIYFITDELDYTYNIDDYIIVSLRIYIDILRFLLYILSSMSRSSSEN